MGQGEHTEVDSVQENTRSPKRRKLYNEPQPTSSHSSTETSHTSARSESSPNSTEIKVSSSRFHALPASHAHAQYVQSGSSSNCSQSTFSPHIQARFQHTEISCSSTHSSIPSDPPHTHSHLDDSKHVIPAHIEGPQSEGSSSPQTEIRSLSSTGTQIQNPPGESALTSKRTQSKVLSCSEGTLPSQKACLSYAHQLPHDIIISNIVASRMSLINLIRARSVCRAWRDSIFSPVYAKSFSANADCQRPRLVIEHSSSSGPSLAVFDPLIHGWSVIPAPCFGRLVAASSGLFCYVTEAGRPPSLVVGNPLTNQWKHLPAIPLCVPAHGPQIVAMVANKPAGSYKVMVLFGMWDDDVSDAYLPFMYDSLSERWMRRSTISAMLSFATSRSVVKTPEILLSVDSNASNLLYYDMTTNEGHTTQLKHVPLFINDEDQKTNLWRRLPQVAVCKGALFLVARCIGDRTPECNFGQLPIVQHSSVGIWMTPANSDEWQFITRMPLDLLEILVKGSDGTDFIIASNSGSTLFFVLKGSPFMLAYDSMLYTWTVLPGCPADYRSYPLHQSAFYEPLLWVSAM